MKSKLISGLAIIAGIGMIVFGLNKVFFFLPMPEMTLAQQEIFAAMSKIKWLAPLIGIGEVIGGILIIISKYRALGAIVLFPITLGATLHHLVLDPAGVGLAAFYFLINIFFIWENRSKYFPMIESNVNE